MAYSYTDEPQHIDRSVAGVVSSLFKLGTLITAMIQTDCSVAS